MSLVPLHRRNWNYGSSKKKKKKQTEAQRLAHRDAVIAHADNKFVAELTEKMDAFIYTKDFYIALYKQLEKGMTAIEAYESLGFDTKHLEKTVRSLQPKEQDKRLKMASLNQRQITLMEVFQLKKCLK